MSPILIKGLIAAGGIGLGGVGIWQITEHTGPRTIREKLEGEGKTFPSMVENQDTQTWKSLYEKNNTSDSSPKIEGISNSASDDNAKAKAMQDKCREIMNRKLSEANDGDIDKVRQRCTKPTT